MLELYNFPESTCSQKVRLCLAEKGLDWIDRRLDHRKGEHLALDYLSLNPNGVVPTLVHDGAPVIDSSVIMEYLEEVFPRPPLSPSDPLGRARLRAWLRFLEEVPTAAIRYPSFNSGLVSLFRALPEDVFQARAEARPLRKHFYRRMGQGGFSEADMQASMDNLRLTLERMDSALGKGGPWILGELSLVDFCVAPTIDRMRDLGLSAMWSDLPRIADWLARLEARPAFAAAFYPGSRFSDHGFYRGVATEEAIQGS